MKRRWGRILQGLLAILVVLYLGDWITLRVRTGAHASNSVQVEQFLRTPLKGQKEEFDYMGTVAATVRARALSPLGRRRHAGGWSGIKFSGCRLNRRWFGVAVRAGRVSGTR